VSDNPNDESEESKHEYLQKRKKTVENFQPTTHSSASKSETYHTEAEVILKLKEIEDSQLSYDILSLKL
jgi:hypothetical protein